MRLIHELRKVTKTVDKKEILKTADPMEQAVLAYTYSIYKNYGIANRVPTKALGEPNGELFILLDKLNSRELTGNKARDAVDQFAENYGHLIYLICKKDLRAGISTKTINSVFSYLVPEFQIQLAKEIPLENLKFPIYGEIKYDGVRMITIISKGEVNFYTRNGKSINIPKLTKILEQRFDDTYRLVLDGELASNTGKSKDRTKVSGMVNSALHGGELDIDLVSYYVFDVLDYNEFRRKYCSAHFGYRLQHLTDLFDNHLAYIGSIEKSNVFEIKSASAANNYFEQVISQGYEGLILKAKDHVYSFKRSNDWVKMKSVKTVELRCHRVDRGEKGTKYEFDIGSLRCYGIVEGVRINVSVGSGLTDFDRAQPECYFLGKIIEVKYNSVIDNSLFLPRFVAIREDK